MPGRWIRPTTFALDDFPAAAGCYVVLCDPKFDPVLGKPPGTCVLYVGQSTNLRARFRQHALSVPQMPAKFRHLPYPAGFTSTPWGVFENVRVKYRPSVRYGDWAMVELRLIRRLRPRFNSCPLAKRARLALR